MQTHVTHRAPMGRYLAPLMVVVAIAAAGCSSQREISSSSAPPTITVTVDHVRSVNLPSRIEAGGVVEASATARTASQLVAQVQEVFVRAGDQVSRGQRLATLDSREMTSHAERVTAALTAATSAARAAESRLAAAEATLRLATATHARISALHDKKSATSQELDQAVAARQSAEAQVEGARAESASAAASREAARAETETAAVTQSYTVITAPFDGRVAERLIDPGSLASPGMPLLVLEASGPARLVVRLDDSRAAGLAPGQQAEVRLDGDAKSEWAPVKVLEVARTDPASHSVLVKLELPQGRTARTGSFGRARFAGQTRPTLVVPSSSLLHRAGLTFVFIVDNGNVARLRPVVTGEVDGQMSELLSGLTEQDVVIVNPTSTLSDGALVALTAAQAAARGPRP